MRILHVADTHLGYSAYRKVNEDGLNQREVDVYKAFEQCIDYAIDSKPDVVVHAGDLFDSVRPSNRAIGVAIRQIIRLSEEKIPFVVISGNHETPRLKGTGSIFNVFEHLDYVYPVYGNRYERVSFDTDDGRVTIHAVPQCINKEGFFDNLKKISVDGGSDFNVFTTHGCVKGMNEFSMNEFNEQVIPQDVLDKGFDYVALGHYHKNTLIQDNVFYSGSTERFSFAESGCQKGFLDVRLDGEVKPRFVEITTRPMLDIPFIDCSNQGVEEVMRNIKKAIEEIEPNGKIFRIRLRNIASHVFRGIDLSHIRKLCQGCVHFEIRSDATGDEELRVSEGHRIDSIMVEFERFVREKKLPDKDVLLKLGLKYIQDFTKEEG